MCKLPRLCINKKIRPSLWIRQTNVNTPTVPQFIINSENLMVFYIRFRVPFLRIYRLKILNNIPHTLRPFREGYWNGKMECQQKGKYCKKQRAQPFKAML